MREAKWRRYLRFWRPNVDADVDDELRFHFAERIEDLVARGRTREQARHEAIQDFGDVDDVRAALRTIDRRALTSRLTAERWDRWIRDVMYSAGRLRRSPGVPLTIIVTLAIGIGINATLFSLLDRVFLRMPSGIAQPGRVRRLYWTGRGMEDRPMAFAQFSIPLAAAIQEAAGGAAHVTTYRLDTRHFGDDDEAKTVVASVGAGYFALLGVRPAFGRLFMPDEDNLTVPADVAVVSEAFWSRRFPGSLADALGQSIVIDKHRFTVVGVAPRDFVGSDLDAVDIWVPLGTVAQLARFGATDGGPPWYRQPGLYAFGMLTRPQPNIGYARLEAMATVGLRRGFQADPWRKNSRILSGPLIAARGPETHASEIAISTRLGGVALIVFFIACANVANLLLARSIQRRRELAVRTALGMTRRGIMRLLLSESMLLAIVAGLTALLIASWSGAVLRTMLFPSVSWRATSVDWRVAAFTLAVTLLAGVAAGVLPAIQSSRADVTQTLKAGARDGSIHHSRTRMLLIVLQSALSTVLLVGAALFVRSLHSVRALHLGFDVQELAFVSVHFESGQRAANEAALAANLPAVADRLTRVRGVERVALSTFVPLYDIGFTTLFYQNGDSLPPYSDGAPEVTGVSADFFAATGIRIRRGRGVEARDVREASPVAVVNETLAKTTWRHDDPIGQCLRLDKPTAPCVTVVGIVEDARRSRLIEQPVRQLYVPVSHSSEYSASIIVVRVLPAHAADVEAAARREVPLAFPGARASVLRMADLLAPQYRPWELGATLFSIFGLLALVVSAVGVFSAVWFTVGQRRHELGVRIALGASVTNVLRLVVGNGLRVVLIGTAIGTLLAIGGGRLIGSLLYGVSPTDPAALGTVSLMLLGAAVLACAIPAWRASRVDPVEALRAE